MPIRVLQPAVALHLVPVGIAAFLRFARAVAVDSRICFRRFLPADAYSYWENDRYTAEDIMYHPAPRVDRWEPFIAGGLALVILVAIVATALSR